MMRFAARGLTTLAVRSMPLYSLVNRRATAVALSTIARHQSPPLVLPHLSAARYAFGLSIVRRFGQSRPVQRMKHGHIRHSRALNALLNFLCFNVLFLFIDWDNVYLKTGFQLPHALYQLYTPRAGNATQLEFIELKRVSREIWEEKDKQRQGKSHAEAAAEMTDEERADRLASVAAALKRIQPPSLNAESDFGGAEVSDVSRNEQRPPGFKMRKIMEYENRIRQYSTPDKVFRYFATCKIVDDKGHAEVMMTPNDFLRSLTPGEVQPTGLGLDQFRTVNVRDVTVDASLAAAATTADSSLLAKDSIFRNFASGGLLSFADYIFLVTVVGTSRRHLEIALRMFDLDGDGKLDVHEFDAATQTMRGHVSSTVAATGGSSSSGGSITANAQSGGGRLLRNSSLASYFFGPDCKGELTIGQFLDFQKRLQDELLTLEFRRKCKSSSDTATISERAFAELIIAYAGFSDDKRRTMLRRVAKKFDGAKAQGVHLDEFVTFFQMLYAINDVDTALTFHRMAGATVDVGTLQRAASVVAGVQLTDHVADVVAVLFRDESATIANNGSEDVALSDEFVAAMRRRVMHGLERPRDTGLANMMSAVATCTRRHADHYFTSVVSTSSPIASDNA